MLSRFPYHFYPEQLRLLQAFNLKQSELTDSFIVNIDEHVQTYTREEFQQRYADDIGEVCEVEISHIAGISEDEYDFKAVFVEIMPMYQHQSMLVSSWSMFECELTKFYSYFAELVGQSPEIPKKKSGSDLNHLINCFRNLGLLTIPSSEFSQAFEKLDGEVRLVRNDWVHTGGVPNNITDPTVIDGISLNGSQMNISPAYIEEATEAMWTLSSEITKSARELLVSTSS